MATRITFPPTGSYTSISRRRESGDDLIGFVSGDARIYRLRWNEGTAVGRVEGQRVFRFTQYDEREVGTFSADGRIHSHGLFEGGALGWLDPDGTVVQAGLILGEEEIGFVEGPDAAAAAAALLLIFRPDEQEQQRQMDRS